MCQRDSRMVVSLLFFFISSGFSQTQFVKTLSVSTTDCAHSLIQTSDGGYVVAGHMWGVGEGLYDVYVAKFDSSGDYQWTTILGGEDSEYAHSIIETSDGGYAMAGQTKSFGVVASDVFLVKLDSLGNHEWAQTLGGEGDDNAYSLIQALDGGYMIAGYTSSHGVEGSDILLVKLDSLWNHEWSRTLGGSDYEAAYSVIQAAGQGYAVTGYTRSFGAGGTDVLVVKFDSSGTHEWTRTLGGVDDDDAFSLAQTMDGGYLLAGRTKSFGAGLDDVLFVRLDNLGNCQWARTLGGEDPDIVCSLVPSGDSEYVAAGWTHSFGAGEADVLLTAFDHLGNYGWARTVGGPQMEYCQSLTRLSSGGYAIGGETHSFGAVHKDVLVVRFDASGNTCLGDFVAPSVDSVNLSMQTVTPSVNSPTPTIVQSSPSIATPDPRIATICVSGPRILTISPSQNELNRSVDGNIVVVFDTDMDASTINESTLVVRARSTGLHDGTIIYDNLTKTATFNPSADFHVGEVVTVVLTRDIKSSEGVPLESGFAWSFGVEVDDGCGTFVHGSSCPAGIGPTTVFAADLDGDGDIDLATADWVSHSVHVLSNRGDGTFAHDSGYALDRNPAHVAVGDLDSDHDLDLATAGFAANGNVSVLFNNGDGTFFVDSVYSVGSFPHFVAAADVDGDGNLDLAVANTVSNNVSVLLNSGNGSFESHIVYPVDNGPASVIAGDLDRDGDLDLATANEESSNVSVLLNNGNGSFASYSSYPAGTLPHDVFAADLDADGDLDLMAANRGSNDVSVLLNNGDGTFVLNLHYLTGYAPHETFGGDLDGDGDIDLATANLDSDDVSILLNNGDGTFIPSGDYGVGGDTRSVFIADLDGDGDLDLVTTNQALDSVSILLNEEPYMCGDCNGDDRITIADANYIVSYIYRNGPPPLGEGDVNLGGRITIADAIHLVTYIYRGGPAPCEPSVMCAPARQRKATER